VVFSGATAEQASRIRAWADKNGYSTNMGTSQKSQVDGAKGGASGIGGFSFLRPPLFDGGAEAALNSPRTTPLPRVGIPASTAARSVGVTEGAAARIAGRIGPSIVAGSSRVAALLGGVASAILGVMVPGDMSDQQGVVLGSMSGHDPNEEDGAVTLANVAGSDQDKRQLVTDLKQQSTPYFSTSDNVVRLYRAVTAGERDQVIKSGQFEAGTNSLGGKWFAESQVHAQKWGDLMNGEGNSIILEVSLPKAQADQLMRLDRLDGVGAARYGELEQLKGAEIRVLDQ